MTDHSESAVVERCGHVFTYDTDDDALGGPIRAALAALTPGDRLPGGNVVAQKASSPDDIRWAGWSVAIHNDYVIRGEPHTFWLFTSGSKCVKGEGKTDADALNEVRFLLWGSSHDQGEMIAASEEKGAAG